MGVAFLLTGADAAIDTDCRRRGSTSAPTSSRPSGSSWSTRPPSWGSHWPLLRSPRPTSPCSSAPASEEDDGCSLRRRRFRPWSHGGRSSQRGPDLARRGRRLLGLQPGQRTCSTEPSCRTTSPGTSHGACSRCCPWRCSSTPEHSWRRTAGAVRITRPAPDPRAAGRLPDRGPGLGLVALPREVRRLPRLRPVGSARPTSAPSPSRSLPSPWSSPSSGHGRPSDLAGHRHARPVQRRRPSRRPGRRDHMEASTISELNLAVPFIVLALVLVPYANRKGWGGHPHLAPGCPLSPSTNDSSPAVTRSRCRGGVTIRDEGGRLLHHRERQLPVVGQGPEEARRIGLHRPGGVQLHSLRAGRSGSASWLAPLRRRRSSRASPISSRVSATERASNSGNGTRHPETDRQTRRCYRAHGASPPAGRVRAPPSRPSGESECVRVSTRCLERPFCMRPPQCSLRGRGGARNRTEREDPGSLSPRGAACEAPPRRTH